MKKYYSITIALILTTAFLIYINLEKNTESSLVKSLDKPELGDISQDEIHNQHDHTHSQDNPESKNIEHTHASTTKVIVEDTAGKLCKKNSPDEDFCDIDVSIDLEDTLIDSNLNVVNSDDIGAILHSNNYDEVMQSLTGLNSDNIMLSENFNQKIKIISRELGINVESKISCSEKLCVASFKMQDIEKWDDFSSAFFSEEGTGGAIFIATDPKQSDVFRVIFASDDGMSVVKKEH